MEEARQIWIKALACAALCLGAPVAVLAQSPLALPSSPHSVQIQSPQSGSLAGRLTDLRSSPLAGISITLRNQSTGVEFHTATAKSGAFRFASIDAGEYTLEADAEQLGHGRLEGILVTGGNESRVQAAIEFVPAIPPRANAAPLVLAASPVPIAPHSAASAPPLLAASTASARTFSAPRPDLAISSPLLVASIAPRPVFPMPLAASRTIDVDRPLSRPNVPEQPAPQFVPRPPPASPPATIPSATRSPALPPAANPQPAPTSASHPNPIAALTRRAALDTQSIVIQLALSTPQLRVFPLRSVASLAPAVTLPASAVRAAIANLPPAAAAESSSPPSGPVAPAVNTTVTATQLQELPATGRRWQDFLFDTPAASAPAGSSQASFRGSSESAGLVIDGANTRLAFGASAGSGLRASDPAGGGTDQHDSVNRSWAGGHGLGIGEAAILEVTASSGNVEAEGMRSSGGQTSIRTESGSSQLHGQGSFFDRQNTWGARNPFTQWVQNTGTMAAPSFTAVPFTPPDHEMVWGLGVGGRIRRGKLFWFAALDTSHRNDPGLSMVRHPEKFFAQPSNDEMQALSARLDLPSTDPVGEGLAAYWPMLETLAGLLGPAPRTSSHWTGFLRFDWHVAERHHFTLEGTGARSNSPGGGLTRVSETYGSHSFGSRQASREWLLARWKVYLSPNLLATTQGSAGHTVLGARPGTPSDFERSFLAGNAYGQLPQIVVDSRYGFTIGNPSRFGPGDYPNEHLYHGQQMLAWAHGRLLVRGGFEIDHDFDSVSQLRNQTGTYHYSKVENFVSDALAFGAYGPSGVLNPASPYNCDQTGKVWRDSAGNLRGLGYLPCDSYYSQTLGPTNWHLSTNDWAGYLTAQWQPNKIAVFSAGLRWERQQMPPPIASVANPELTASTPGYSTPPLTRDLPSPGNNWGPRVALAIGNTRGHWPVFRLGYGMYFSRVQNATIETALTHTGSLKSNLNIFIRPTDGYNSFTGRGGAPIFPTVLTGNPASVVKPSAIGLAPNFRNPEVHQAVASIEQRLPGRVELTVEAMVSLGRRLPIAIDTNIDTANASTITYNVKDPSGQGPIKTAQIKVPFYASVLEDCASGSSSASGHCGRLDPNYQQITQVQARANSTYEAGAVRIARSTGRGLGFRAHYTYAHAMDWNPDESTLAAVSGVFDPKETFRDEYGVGNLDVRHSAAAMVVFEAPWKRRDFAGHFANGWMLSGIGQFHSGLPYTMRTTGSIPTQFGASTIVGLGPGMNGSGGENRVYGVGRNTFRYPSVWKADLRLTKRFNIGEGRQLELLAETFNLFNHRNVTGLETAAYSIENNRTSGGLPTLCYLTVSPTTGNDSCGSSVASGSPPLIPAFGQPLNINATDFYRERQIQLGLRFRF